ncbi:b8eb9a6d-44dc-4d83-84e0-7c0a012a607e [Thermothielavioides terrestris]|jgi:hypothetical protein|uniref:B8eb9a6d-44dc-4d83-84e0-7c0a012a607e n=1 Tax=Thermothielavioides terrestris TaxID=2587410 RepID=A0A3S4AW94_9PEZI|nr:b8eb9a6d-44dc-4d83-84e0-7c0a012a607e [Thermothielavioides terrestris]
MAGSPICPCSSCFASSSQHVTAQQQKQPDLSDKPHCWWKKRDHSSSKELFSKLRRTRTIDSTTSTLVGLTSDAQPMGELDEKH